MWLRMAGEVMSIYIYLGIHLFGLCYVSGLPIAGHIFSETWILMTGEFRYILYSYDKLQYKNKSNISRFVRSKLDQKHPYINWLTYMAFIKVI